MTEGGPVTDSANNAVVAARYWEPTAEYDEAAIRAMVRDTVDRFGAVLDELGDD